MTKRGKQALGVAVVAVAATALWLARSGDEAEAKAGPFSPPSEISGPIEVTAPDTLGPLAQRGKLAFDANCAECHGENGAGTEQGPPLVHVIYEPNHHGDGAFYSAALNGVRAHHWRHGDMPPVAGMTPEAVEAIIAYIRETQRANGVE